MKLKLPWLLKADISLTARVKPGSVWMSDWKRGTDAVRAS